MKQKSASNNRQLSTLFSKMAFYRLLLPLLSLSSFVRAQNVTYTNSTTGAACACSELSALPGSQILFPSSANYTQETTDAYWDVRANANPACIFMPRTADEVSSAMAILNSCQAYFAVRGGGHMNVCCLFV